MLFILSDNVEAQAFWTALEKARGAEELSRR